MSTYIKNFPEGGFGSERNKATATLFENAPEMFGVLRECRSALATLSHIDRASTSVAICDLVAKIDKTLEFATETDLGEGVDKRKEKDAR
jgi:exonuclease I